VDVYSFYKPGIIDNAIAGKVWEFQITQVWLLGVIILMTIPSLMVFLSLTLPAKANRWTNIIVGILEIVYVLGGAIGESWVYYIFASIVEAVLLLLIVVYAWKWPTHERVEVTP
jgi:signal transduction histidine kinase